MQSNVSLAPEAMRAEISESVYRTLSGAGDICAEYSQTDPDMLDSIADGIIRFLADGDVFEQVIATLMEREPQLISRCLDNVKLETCRTIITGILGQINE